MTKARRAELCEKRRQEQAAEDELAAQTGRPPRPVAGTVRHFSESDSSMPYPQDERHHWDAGEAIEEAVEDGSD